VRSTYLLHILAGVLGLASGYVALYATKGAPLHRRSGMVFVVTMLATSAGGLAIAIVRDVAPAINIPAALLTSYLVVTALTTVRPLGAGAGVRRLHVALMLLALAVGLTSLSYAFEAVANGGTRDGMPSFPFFMFGVVSLLGVVGDLRLVRSGPLQGASRLARHLWRMTFALFIAALSFFIGQADVFPEPIRIRPLLALPVVLVLATLLYWLWRIKIRRSLRGIVHVRAAEAA